MATNTIAILVSHTATSGDHDMLLHRLINSVPGFAENLSTDVHYTDPNYLNYNEPIHDTSSTDYINTRSSSSTSTRSDIDMLYPHARPVWKDMQVLPRLLAQHGIDTIVDARDAFKRPIIVDTPAAPTLQTHLHQGLHQRGLHRIFVNT
jgi:hypothetical protein